VGLLKPSRVLKCIGRGPPSEWLLYSNFVLSRRKRNAFLLSSSAASVSPRFCLAKRFFPARVLWRCQWVNKSSQKLSASERENDCLARLTFVCLSAFRLHSSRDALASQTTGKMRFPTRLPLAPRRYESCWMILDVRLMALSDSR
jgi:hypothetical protein